MTEWLEINFASCVNKPYDLRSHVRPEYVSVLFCVIGLPSWTPVRWRPRATKSTATTAIICSRTQCALLCVRTNTRTKGASRRRRTEIWLESCEHRKRFCGASAALVHAVSRGLLGGLCVEEHARDRARASSALHNFFLLRDCCHSCFRLRNASYDLRLEYPLYLSVEIPTDKQTNGHARRPSILSHDKGC